MIAALFVEAKGTYSTIPDLDLWDIKRDARKYVGNSPVLAHPPCQRWGKYWSGGPSHHGRFKLGDDDGCFASAIASVRRCRGVLEHPMGSKAWEHFGLSKPPRSGGWIPAGDGMGWTCCVDQGHYGHPCPKATWLYFVGPRKPKDLIWGKSDKASALIDRSGNREKHAAQRAAGLKYLSKKARASTPRLFAETLINLVKEYC